MSEFAEVIQDCIKALISQDRMTAHRALLRVAEVPSPCALRASASCLLQARVFVRDRFTCRYCGRRTLLPPVLRLVASVFPDVLPYHPHGKLSHCHTAFWREISSCDHIVPVARGGTTDESNLVTSCYMCNSMKQSWLLEEIRWQLLPVSSCEWDGLSSH